VNSIPTSALIIIVLTLVALSALFSASETAMMAVNRYKLKNQADSGNAAAIRVLRLLENPDRLLGAILIGNNIANISASSIATLIGLRIYGDIGIGIATGVLVFIVLIFAEVAPKTLAAQFPEKIAFPASFILSGLLRVLKPFIFVVNFIANNFLRLFGIRQEEEQNALNIDELRAAVKESSKTINSSYQDMLLGVLEMDSITVNDVMVPTNSIGAINIDEDWETILEQITYSNYTRVPVYEKSMENVLGILHLRKTLSMLREPDFNEEKLRALIRAPFFIPENLPIAKALNHLQMERRRFALVVDEYGSLKGLITMEEILEEIVGDYTRFAMDSQQVTATDGSTVVRGDTSIRDLNRKMQWNLPQKHAKTINGLLLHVLEEIPKQPACIQVNDYQLEIIRTSGTLIRSVRIRKNH